MPHNSAANDLTTHQITNLERGESYDKWLLKNVALWHWFNYLVTKESACVKGIPEND
jgi:hypothetical protein